MTVSPVQTIAIVGGVFAAVFGAAYFALGAVPGGGAATPTVQAFGSHSVRDVGSASWKTSPTHREMATEIDKAQFAKLGGVDAALLGAHAQPRVTLGLAIGGDLAQRYEARLGALKEREGFTFAGLKAKIPTSQAENSFLLELPANRGVIHCKVAKNRCLLMMQKSDLTIVGVIEADALENWRPVVAAYDRVTDLAMAS